jgi:hypothetical protein
MKRQRVKTATIRWHGGWRQIAGLLAVFAILSQTIVLLVHRPPSAAPIDLEMTAAMGPLCTMGAEDVPASDPNDADKAPRKSPPICPICQSLQLSSHFMPPVPAVPVPAHVVVAAALGVVGDQPASAFSINHHARPRAPPAMAGLSPPTIDG